MSAACSPPRRRCENCTLWSSADRVWGDCIYPRENNAEARALYVERGVERQARLETHWDFACAAWRSVAVALRTAVARNSGP